MMSQPPTTKEEDEGGEDDIFIYEGVAERRIPRVASSRGCSRAGGQQQEHLNKNESIGCDTSRDTTIASVAPSAEYDKPPPGGTTMTRHDCPLASTKSTLQDRSDQVRRSDYQSAEDDNDDSLIRDRSTGWHNSRNSNNRLLQRKDDNNIPRDQQHNSSTETAVYPEEGSILREKARVQDHLQQARNGPGKGPPKTKPGAEISLSSLHHIDDRDSENTMEDRAASSSSSVIISNNSNDRLLRRKDNNNIPQDQQHNYSAETVAPEEGSILREKARIQGRLQRARNAREKGQPETKPEAEISSSSLHHIDVEVSENTMEDSAASFCADVIIGSEAGSLELQQQRQVHGLGHHHRVMSDSEAAEDQLWDFSTTDEEEKVPVESPASSQQIIPATQGPLDTKPAAEIVQEISSSPSHCVYINDDENTMEDRGASVSPAIFIDSEADGVELLQQRHGAFQVHGLGHHQQVLSDTMESDTPAFITAHVVDEEAMRQQMRREVLESLDEEAMRQQMRREVLESLQLQTVEGQVVQVEMEENVENSSWLGLSFPAFICGIFAKATRVLKNRRFKLYAFFACSLIISLAIGLSVVFALIKQDEAAEPSEAPTSYRESLGIKDQIESVVGKNVLENLTSPYSKALEWITFDDPLQVTPESANLIQRYIAAYLYFATTVDGPWRSCNPPGDPWSGKTICTWSKLIDTPNGDKFVDIYPATTWLSNSSECNWTGLRCDSQGQVTFVEMAGFNLSGTFPEGIFNLPHVQGIVMSLGTLKGPLPTQLGTLDNLINIALVHNQFSGSIPHEWWTARNLRSINIGHNMITGTVSTGIAYLQDLKYLRLQHNKLSGSVPSEIGLLKSLIVCDLSFNKIVGGIPYAMWKMFRLQALKLQSNDLTGSIPHNIGNLDNLLELHLSNNPKLTGQLPDALFDHTTALRTLDISKCRLFGNLSPKIGYHWKNLRTLKLSHNIFYGSIPAELAMLGKLQNVWLHGNAFTGTLPESICWSAPSGLEDLDKDLDKGKDPGALHHTKAEVTADCAPGDDEDIELTCSCCTVCCKPNGKLCLPR